MYKIIGAVAGVERWHTPSFETLTEAYKFVMELDEHFLAGHELVEITERKG